MGRDSAQERMTTRNIIILPPPDIAKLAIGWSKDIAERYPTKFILDGKNYYPHITLYQAAYPDKNVHTAEEQLLRIASQSKPFQIGAGEFSTLVGFVFLDFVKTGKLFSLHKKIVEVCNPLREGEIIPAEIKNLANPEVPEYIKHSIRTFGSALAMDVYMPHISISRLQSFTQAEKASQLLEKKKIAFEVKSIFMANIGLDGTVNEILREFPFK